jgi:hypothetical protein
MRTSREVGGEGEHSCDAMAFCFVSTWLPTRHIMANPLTRLEPELVLALRVRVGS